MHFVVCEGIFPIVLSAVTLIMIVLSVQDKYLQHIGYCIISLLSEGEKEETIDMLRSILAQFEYHYQVCLWDSKGVPFRTYLYVPEIHPITGKEFHEREDFAHVLKVK